MRKSLVIGSAILLVGVAGCSNTPSGIKNDQKATNIQLDRYVKNQPIPGADWSQYRQTLLDVNMAQIHGVATTAFFFNQGATNPYKVCPSIGFPVATTAQLTNPEQIVNQSSHDDLVIPQQEPNGVYTGDSTGTYVVCVSVAGKKYISYAEGFVHAEGGPAHWDSGKAQVVLDGDPTVGANTKAGP